MAGWVGRKKGKNSLEMALFSTSCTLFMGKKRTRKVLHNGLCVQYTHPSSPSPSSKKREENWSSPACTCICAFGAAMCTSLRLDGCMLHSGAFPRNNERVLKSAEAFALDWRANFGSLLLTFSPPLAFTSSCCTRRHTRSVK